MRHNRPAVVNQAPAAADGSADDDQDRERFAAACAGDADAFAALARRHGPACLSLARRVLRDPHMAQDAVQEALLAAWRFRHTCDPERTTARSWLLTLTHHKAVDRVRMEELRRADSMTEARLRSLVDQAAGPDEVAWQRSRATSVRAAVQRLPPAQRDVLVLCYVGGLTQRQLAHRRDIPLGTVKTRALAGLRTLRQDVELATATS